MQSRGSQTQSNLELNLLRRVIQAVQEGHRGDRTLSLLFREEDLSKETRARMLTLVRAWYHWFSVLPAELPLRDRLQAACLLDDNPQLAPLGAETLPWKAADPLADLGAVNEEELALLRVKLGWLGERFNRPAPRPQDLLPNWIRQHLPAEIAADRLAAASLRAPSLWLRSTLPIAELSELIGPGLSELRPHPVLKNCVRAICQRDLYSTPAFRDGIFVLQDPASQAIGIACDPKPGQRWLDLCAGAGGKTLQLASMMEGRGLVMACDIHEGRLRELRRRARRTQQFNLQLQHWDGVHAPGGQPYHGVLVDAPCSNSGTLRRNPDLRSRHGLEGLEDLLDIQARLLRIAARRLRKDGRLVYSTCSLLPEENEQQVLDFLAQHEEFQLQRFPHPLGKSHCEGWLRLDPADGDHDGTFMAVLIRQS